MQQIDNSMAKANNEEVDATFFSQVNPMLKPLNSMHEPTDNLAYQFEGGVS